MSSNSTSHYADINGLHMYYEIHGNGQPLVLIHGGMSAIGTSFGSVLPKLAEQRQVIAVELQGHGRTADIDRPFSYEAFADDIAALIQELKLAQPDVMGYSVGAGTALMLALRHPGVVRRLVLAAVSYNDSAIYPEVKAMSGSITPEMMEGSPFHEEYVTLAPHPEAWPQFVAKTADFEHVKQDWPADKIQALGLPAFLIAGDSDIIMPEHTIALFRLLGGGVPGDMGVMADSRLAILPATTHVTLMEHPQIPAMVHDFLEAEIAKTDT